MRSNCLTLTKIHLINNLRLSAIRLEKDPKKRRNHLLVLLPLLLLPFVFTVYTFGIGYGLCQMGLTSLVPAYGLTIASILTLFLTLLKTNGVLFGFKDYDILMSLPVKTSTVIASRFLTLYITNVFLSVLMMLPMTVAYFMFVDFNLVSCIFWVCGALLAPLVPTTLGAMVGALIVWIASRFKHSNMLSILLSFLLFGGIMIIPFAFNPDTVSLAEITDLSVFMGDMVKKIYPLTIFFSGAVIHSAFSDFLIFAGISIGWYYLFIKLLATQYKAINTALSTHYTARAFKETALSSTSPLKALYKKELKRFLNSYIYIFNMGAGIIMAILACISLPFVGIDTVAESMGFSKTLLASLLPFAVCTVCALSCTSCVSLSLEGNHLWIVKSSPITPKTLFDSKILVTLTLLVPTSLICSTLLVLTLKPGLLQGLLTFIVTLSYAFFSGVWGMWINTKFPRYEWESDTQIVKQSTSAMVGMLGGAVFSIIPVILFFALPQVNPSLITFGIIVFINSITALMYRKLCNIQSF
ncbi:MAG: hypothetical protein ACRCWY_09685 [Cellulosilyticaceae bacterium]